MIETSTTKWLTPAEATDVLGDEITLERVLVWLDLGRFYGSWQGPDGWLIPAALVESWRAASDSARRMNASGKIDIPTFEGSDQDFEDMREEAHWHREWMSPEVAAVVLGVTPEALPGMNLLETQELPDGTWRFDDLQVERRRRVEGANV